MSNNWINWRFGCWHLHVGPDECYWIALVKNPYWVENKPERWFESY